MSKKTPKPPPPPDAVLAEWWTPFADYLAKERRYSPYTLRNYRQAFDDFYRWRVTDKKGPLELAY